MDKGLHIEVVWFDDHVVEVRVRAANDRFCGVADCYVGRDFFTEVADALRGFPSSPKDRRDVVAGTFDPGFAGDGAKIGLRCTDLVGHAVADVLVQADARGTSGHRESASLSLCVEPAEVDAFVAELGSIDLVVGSTAFLRQAP
jgi:hypothetical protein